MHTMVWVPSRSSCFGPLRRPPSKSFIDAGSQAGFEVVHRLLPAHPINAKAHSFFKIIYLEVREKNCRRWPLRFTSCRVKLFPCYNVPKEPSILGYVFAAVKTKIRIGNLPRLPMHLLRKRGSGVVGDRSSNNW